MELPPANAMFLVAKLLTPAEYEFIERAVNDALDTAWGTSYRNWKVSVPRTVCAR